MDDEEPRQKIGLGELIVIAPLQILRGIALIILMPIAKVLEFLNRWEI